MKQVFLLLLLVAACYAQAYYSYGINTHHVPKHHGLIYGVGLHGIHHPLAWHHYASPLLHHPVLLAEKEKEKVKDKKE